MLCDASHCRCPGYDDVTTQLCGASCFELNGAAAQSTTLGPGSQPTQLPSQVDRSDLAIQDAHSFVTGSCVNLYVFYMGL